METKRKNLILDLLVSGECYFKTVKTDGNNFNVEVTDPMNVFVDKNPQSPYVRDGYRSVVRKWLTKTQILSRYGKDMD